MTRADRRTAILETAALETMRNNIFQPYADIMHTVQNVLQARGMTKTEAAKMAERVYTNKIKIMGPN